MITTVAGNGAPYEPLTWPPLPAEGVPATSTPIFAAHISLDRSGNLYLSDVAYHRIRVVAGVGRAEPPPTPAAAPMTPAPASLTTATGTAATSISAGPEPKATTRAAAEAAPMAPIAARTATPSANDPAFGLDGAGMLAFAGHGVAPDGPVTDPWGWKVAASLALVLVASTTSAVWARERRRLT